MYMFFWFFKQLYYCLRRIFKSGILLLIVFFIAFLFIFVKPCFAYTFDTNIPNKTGQYTVPDLETLSSDKYAMLSNGYIIGTYKNGGVTRYTLYLLETPESFFFVNNDSIGFRGVRYTFDVPSTSEAWGNGTRYTNQGVTFGMRYCIYYGSDIYTNSNKTKLYFDYTPPFTNPFIVTDNNSISNWSFDNLTINCGSINPNSHFWLECNYEGYTFSIDLTDYISISNNIAFATIPKSLLNQSIVLRNGFEFGFNLQARQPNMQVYYFELGTYTMDLTSEQQQQINEDSDKQVLSDISNNQKETTQAVENLENTITNTNIDDSSVNLPTDNTNDITQDGLNNIFTSIYNAFCVGEPQNIVFPIPFTNKNITLQPNYIRQMLTVSGANWVITIIEAFWWYLISRFIIKDVSKKITKIKSGNVENIENSNIKEEML